MTSPSPAAMWETYGARRSRGGEWVYERFGALSWLRIVEPRHSHVRVRLVLDPDGRYYGWLSEGRYNPEMVQPSLHRFKVQFPYDYQHEQERGRGRMVRLRVEEVADDFTH